MHTVYARPGLFGNAIYQLPAGGPNVSPSPSLILTALFLLSKVEPTTVFPHQTGGS